MGLKDAGNTRPAQGACPFGAGPVVARVSVVLVQTRQRPACVGRRAGRPAWFTTALTGGVSRCWWWGMERPRDHGARTEEWGRRQEAEASVEDGRALGVVICPGHRWLPARHRPVSANGPMVTRRNTASHSYAPNPTSGFLASCDLGWTSVSEPTQRKTNNPFTEAVIAAISSLR